MHITYYTSHLPLLLSLIPILPFTGTVLTSLVRRLLGFQVGTTLNLDDPQIAIQYFGLGEKPQVIARSTDGSISWQMANGQGNTNLTLQNGPSKPAFDFIATHMDTRFYGTMNGVIHEYQWYPSEPWKFIYIGPVTILNATQLV